MCSKIYRPDCSQCGNNYIYRGPDKSFARPGGKQATATEDFEVHIYFILFIIIIGGKLVLFIYKLSQEECARFREGVPYVKVLRYNPKYLCPKLNGYGDNGQRKVWSSGGSTHCTCQLKSLIEVRPSVWCQITTVQLTLVI
jgi:hypothetical protein